MTPDPRIEAALASLATDEDLVGQLLLVTWEGADGASARAAIEMLRPGGLLFTDNAVTADAAASINLGLDGLADAARLTPLLKVIEHEGGVAQRITDVPDLGSNGEFARSGADDDDACARGTRHADQLRTMGFEMDLAPVLEVDTGSSEPPLGDRSFGSVPRSVARLGAGYIRGLQSGGIAAVGRSFPGRGEPSADAPDGPHLVIQGRDRLLSFELLAFARAAGMPTDVAAIQIGHVAMPRIDESGLPASLSEPIIEGLLRDGLGFQGMVLADDVTTVPGPVGPLDASLAAVQAIAAGADMLVVSGDAGVQRAIRDALLGALASGSLSRDRVSAAVGRVLALKARFGMLGGEPDPESGC